MTGERSRWSRQNASHAVEGPGRRLTAVGCCQVVRNLPEPAVNSCWSVASILLVRTREARICHGGRATQLRMAFPTSLAEPPCQKCYSCLVDDVHGGPSGGFTEITRSKHSLRLYGALRRASGASSAAARSNARLLPPSNLSLNEPNTRTPCC